MNLSIRSRFALTLSITLAALVLVYAASLLLVARERFISELDRRVQFEAYVTGDLIRLSPEQVSQKLRLRDEIATQEHDTPERTIDLEVRQGGTVIYRRQNAQPSGFLSRIEFDPGEPEVLSHVLDGHRIRVRQLGFQNAGTDWFVRAAADEQESAQSLATLRRTVLWGTPVIIALGIALSYGLAARALRPLTRIASQAGAISASNLDRRIGNNGSDPRGAVVTGAGDEIAQLAASFNALLDRLQRAFAELRRFTADASHELRTPLTVMRSLGEVSLASEPGSQGYRETIGQMLEEVDRLTQLAEALLMLARGEAGGWRMEKLELDPGELVEAVCGQLRVLAEERNQTLAVHRSAAPRALTDVNLARLAVMNVVHNAVKFTPEGGRIDVRVGCCESRIRIDVDDTGPGIAASEREKVFERFYRAEPARSGSSRGFGLGLAITRWAIGMLGGTVAVDPSLAQGTRIRIEIPAA